MQLAGKIVVVTGGANGIGRALSIRFAAEGAKAVVVADLDAHGANVTASKCGGTAIEADVARESEVQRLVRETLDRFGTIDLFCSNAGIGADGGPEASDADWEQS